MTTLYDIDLSKSKEESEAKLLNLETYFKHYTYTSNNLEDIIEGFRNKALLRDSSNFRALSDILYNWNGLSNNYDYPRKELIKDMYLEDTDTIIDILDNTYSYYCDLASRADLDLYDTCKLNLYEKKFDKGVSEYIFDKSKSLNDDDRMFLFSSLSNLKDYYQDIGEVDNCLDKIEAYEYERINLFNEMAEKEEKEEVSKEISDKEAYVSKEDIKPEKEPKKVISTVNDDFNRSRKYRYNNHILSNDFGNNNESNLDDDLEF